MNTTLENSYARSTRLAYITTRLVDTPFWSIYNMLPVIIYKELHASPWQLAVMIALKPLVSLLSMYWSAAIDKRRDRLVSNILWARLLGYLPFFFFPFANSPWFFIFSFGLYMMLAVGTVPAWMELLKLNIPNRSRERLFSYTQAFGYMGGGLLPFILGGLLDGYFEAWRWLFPLASLLALTAFCLQKRILVPAAPQAMPCSSSPVGPATLLQLFLKPWANAWRLIARQRKFRYFQLGSMAVGSGLMVIQPALPVFFVDTLKLSYTEIAIALTLCKGLGFAAASPLWAHWIHQKDIFFFSATVAALGCLFPACLMVATWHLLWLYLGYFCYGVMQAGNELLWNMSGPLFAKEGDSSVYTSVNVVAVGLRGCCIPAVGGLVCASCGAGAVMTLSAALCLAATGWFATCRRQSPNVVKIK